jgi:hypothetical protein
MKDRLLKEFKDVFAWTYKNVEGISLKLAQHKIELDTTIPPTHHAMYILNPKYATVIKEDIDKLLATKFIQYVKEATWLSPIVIVPKKNGKLGIYTDFNIFNVTKKNDPYPLPYEVLNTIIGYEAYSFLDGYSKYHQISITLEDRYKIAFVIDWELSYGRSCCLEFKMDLQHIKKVLLNHLENIWTIL